MDKKAEINKILITGVSGLVGSEICKNFLKNGCTVTGVVNDADSKISHSKYNEIKLDLTKDKLTASNLFDGVIHCAAVIPGQIKSEQELFNKNTAIDNSVMEFCKLNNLKLIYFSTAYMYQSPVAKLTEEEELKSNLQGYYLAKKRGEENLASSKINYAIFRISSPYGNLAKQKNVMKLFADKIKAKESVTLNGNGARAQNFIHTDDIYKACLLALNNNKSGLYNLTYNKNYTMLDLANLIKKIYSSNSEIRFDTMKTDAEINLNFDNSKLKRELNWEPEMDLESGLIKTLLN